LYFFSVPKDKQREQIKVRKHVHDIEQQYEKELEILREYHRTDRKEKKILMNDLRELIMSRGDAYEANYQFAFIDPYRVYPFLAMKDHIEGKIKMLQRRLKYMKDDSSFHEKMKRLIDELIALKKLLVTHPQYDKECSRYQKYCLIESAADLAVHEIEDIKDRVLECEKIIH